MRTAAYSSKTNERTKHYSKTVVILLLHFVQKQQHDRDLFDQTLTNAYSLQMQVMTKKAPLSLALAMEPPAET